jgi:hypothetical protein
MMKPWQAFIRQSTQQSKAGKEEQREKKIQQPSLSKLGACVKTQSGS